MIKLLSDRKTYLQNSVFCQSGVGTCVERNDTVVVSEWKDERKVPTNLNMPVVEMLIVSNTNNKKHIMDEYIIKGNNDVRYTNVSYK